MLLNITNDVPDDAIMITVITQVNCDDPCPPPLRTAHSQPGLPSRPTQYAAHLNNNYPLSHTLSQIGGELSAKIIAVVVTLC